MVIKKAMVTRLTCLEQVVGTLRGKIGTMWEDNATFVGNLSNDGRDTPSFATYPNPEGILIPCSSSARINLYLPVITTDKDTLTRIFEIVVEPVHVI
jgi:hypothetical protein